MKKIIIFIGMILLLPFSVNAAATIDINADKSNISIGDTITVTTKVSADSPIGSYEYTLDYDDTKLTLTKGNDYITETANDDSTKSFTKTFQFKVLNTNSNTISVKSYAVISYGFNKEMTVKVNPYTIGTNKPNKISTNLSSMEVSGYKINPDFDKDITNYTLELDTDVKEIEIKATAENSICEINGTGTKKVKEGENKFTITVTNPTNDTKSYELLVTVKEKNPIKVFINDKEFTVVKNTSENFKKDGYEEKNIKINNTDVKALYNSTIDLTLVGLKNNNNIDLYVYDKDKYLPYIEIKNNNLVIVPTPSDKNFLNYEPYSEPIDNKEIICYKKNQESNTCVIYAVNINTGEKNFYVYDLINKTLSKYNNEFENNSHDKISTNKQLLYAAVLTTLVFALIMLIIIMKKRNNKKRIR